ncbi:MAG: sugar nucleotide-binding protein [Candidatus Shapirobacteria bacterium]|jgi:dTDP-4-dehydrorhamnose reductase
MKIIGTGLSGLVGSRIVEILGNQHQFIDFSLDSGVDILNQKQLQDEFQKHLDASLVIHLAAFTDTNIAWAQRGDKSGLCYQLNVIGTQNIANLCQEHKKYLIYVSTDFVFDGATNKPYTEDDLPNPIEWYGQTKFEGEKVVSQLTDSAITRISFPYRAVFAPKKDLIRKIIDGFKNNSLNPFFTDQITTPTFTDDIANGLDYFFKNKPQGTFHLTGSSSQSPFDLANAIAQIFGFDPSLIRPSLLSEYIKNQPPESRPWQKNLTIDNTKITSLGLNFSDLSQGLEKIKEQLQTLS